MAKKKTALTIEERLQQALVPANEQPYDVPENWVWVYLSSAFDVTSSKRVHKSDWLSEGIPFYRTRELVKLSEQSKVDNELFISETLYNEFKTQFGVPQKNDLLVSGVGTIGVPYVISDEKKFYFKDGNVIWLKNKGVFEAGYVYYLYKTMFVSNQIHDMSAGTTVDTYTIVNAKNTIIPLPPLAEQKRIVERIEELFAKLDEAKEKLQEVIDGFAVRKAAILHKAFTGELTKNWRAENGVSDDSWEEKNFDEVANIKSNLVSPFDYLDYPHIAPDSIEKFTGRLLSYRSVREDNVKSPKHLFYKGQILYSKIRPYLSKAVIAEVDGLCSADMYPIEALCNAKYLLRYMLSTEFLVQSTTAGSRSLLPKINQKELSAIKVPLPSLPEQHEIVRLLDALLARERKAQQAAKEALTNIELMKKAVLARAFRGELGTNREKEVSALALLKEVLE